jgi:hypothetical protein
MSYFTAIVTISGQEESTLTLIITVKGQKLGIPYFFETLTLN